MKRVISKNRSSDPDMPNLKNGSSEPIEIVVGTMLSLRTLCESKDPKKYLALHELIKLANDPRYEIASIELQKILCDNMLLDKNTTNCITYTYVLDPSVKNVIESSIVLQDALPTVQNAIEVNILGDNGIDS